MLEAVRYLHSAFPWIDQRFETLNYSGEDTFIALLKDEGQDKGILCIKDSTNSFGGQSFKDVLGQMGHFVATVVGSSHSSAGGIEHRLEWQRKHPELAEWVNKYM